MKNIASSSLLIKDEKGSVLYIIERDRPTFFETVEFDNEQYYTIGDIISVHEKDREISNIQFIYRENVSDFQVIITVI